MDTTHGQPGGARPLMLALMMASLLAVGGCCSCPERGQPHREVAPQARTPEEAYDALAAVLVEHFDSVDPMVTSRADHLITTSWRHSEDPNRLVRTRARGRVIWVEDEGGQALVEIRVIRQFSTHKTEFGELDREQPVWVADVDIPDPTLERQLLLAVRERLAGEIE